MKHKIIKNGLPEGTVLEGWHSHYKILQGLGQGTFGITYLAEIIDSEGKGTGMLVCIKEFFMRDLNGRNGSNVKCSSDKGIYQNYMAKFEREARNLASIKDDNIVRVIESFKGNNTVYYAMSFIAGGTLDDLIEHKHNLKELETLRISTSLAFALSRLHGYGMVHLDLKPANVMMLSGQYPILIDFGLSKHFSPDGQPETSTSIGAGTPGYAPIEQSHYRGKDDNPWPLDIYAFGCTMYKMLTGERPPTAADIFNNGFQAAELLKKGVSPELLAIIKKAMAPMKRDRYQTAEEVHADLTRLLKLREQEGDKTGNVSEQSGSYRDPSDVIYAEVHPVEESRKIEDYPLNGNSHYNQLSFDEEPSPRKGSRNKASTSYLLMSLIAIVVAAIVFFSLQFFKNPTQSSDSNEDNTASIENATEQYGEETVAGEPFTLNLSQTEGKGKPTTINLTVTGTEVKGVWKTRMIDMKVSGTYVNEEMELRSRSNSSTLTLKKQADGSWTGTFSGLGNEINQVTFK